VLLWDNLVQFLLCCSLLYHCNCFPIPFTWIAGIFQVSQYRVD
jgi:hypothetical protein